jgi:predicted nucleic acid-binding protein
MLIPDNAVLADTNIMSFAVRRAPIAREYQRLLAGRTILVSVVTLAELHLLAIKYRWGPTRHMQLRQFLDGFLIVPLSKGMEEIVARLKADRQRAGRTMETADLWIAATALYHKVPLVTHDEDFADTPGLRIITASPSVSELRARLPVTIRPDLLPDMRCRCSM